MSLRERLSQAFSRTQESLTDQINLRFSQASKLDDDFWDELEEALILGDVGFELAEDIVAELRDYSARKALPSVNAIRAHFADTVADMFTQQEEGEDLFELPGCCVLFVGINGSGKTTTVGKLAKYYHDEGRSVLLGSADTFRAAAIEQLDVWSERAGVEVVKRERGADPAGVCFATIDRADELGSDLILVDTSGRLHTSDDLMRELEKIVNVTRKRAAASDPERPVRTVLVIDATTGQNGLQQAKEFNRALDLDGIIVTKLDGTAKGGIALQISHDLHLPILRIGVGEGVDDLRPFDAWEYAAALVDYQPEEE